MIPAGPTILFVGSGDAFGSGGRFQACILVTTDTFRVLLDCGATSLMALKHFGIDPGQIDAIVISHYHADHFGGIPLLILDGQFSRRDRPLAILGPGDVERRLVTAMEIAFPGSSTAARRFPVSFHELHTGTETKVGEASVLTLIADHTPGSDAVVVQLSIGERRIGYTGDTAWAASLPRLSEGADLLICEAYTWEKAVPYHLSYSTLSDRRRELAPKRMVLTHLGPEMLAHLPESKEETAWDGLKIAL
jgi:ribonuclease BN (tRNA processing enzyme)